MKWKKKEWIDKIDKKIEEKDSSRECNATQETQILDKEEERANLMKRQKDEQEFDPSSSWSFFILILLHILPLSVELL